MTSDVKKAKSKLPGHAIVIPGEASETDEEAEPETKNEQGFVSTCSQLPIKKSSQIQNAPECSQKSKHDSLLHRKLREAHINLAIDVAETTGKTTHHMSNEIQKTAQNVSACQITLQDATCHIRSVADDLYKVDDSLDAIFNCHAIIPDLFTVDNFPAIKQYSNFK